MPLDFVVGEQAVHVISGKKVVLLSSVHDGEVRVLRDDGVWKVNVRELVPIVYKEMPKSYKEMCEKVSLWLREEFSIAMTSEQVWNISPTGELHPIHALYERAEVYFNSKNKDQA